MDWAECQIRNEVNAGIFVLKPTKHIYTSKEDMDYIILTMKRNSDEFTKKSVLHPVYNKACKTLLKLMKDLQVDRLYPLLKVNYRLVTVENTTKLLI
jgi:hypothetical protein